MKLDEGIKGKLQSWFKELERQAILEEQDHIRQCIQFDDEWFASEVVEIEADIVIERMMGSCGWSPLECAIIEALLKKNGYVRASNKKEAAE